MEERQKHEPVPKLQYTQQNEDKCLYASCASALHYCGLTDMAKDVFHLFDKRKKELEDNNTLMRTTLVDVIDAIRSIFTDKQSKYKKCIQTMKIKPTRFNLLNDSEPSLSLIHI